MYGGDRSPSPDPHIMSEVQDFENSRTFHIL